MKKPLMSISAHKGFSYYLCNLLMLQRLYRRCFGSGFRRFVLLAVEFAAGNNRLVVTGVFNVNQEKMRSQAVRAVAEGVSGDGVYGGGGRKKLLLGAFCCFRRVSLRHSAGGLGE